MELQFIVGYVSKGIFITSYKFPKKVALQYYIESRKNDTNEPSSLKNTVFYPFDGILWYLPHLDLFALANVSGIEPPFRPVQN
jgi:hypothetical protein